MPNDRTPHVVRERVWVEKIDKDTESVVEDFYENGKLVRSVVKLPRSLDNEDDGTSQR